METQPFGSSKRLNEKGVSKDERNGCTDTFSTRRGDRERRDSPARNVTDRVVRLFDAIRASYRSRVTLELDGRRTRKSPRKPGLKGNVSLHTG